MKKIHLLINVFVFIALLSATGFITSVNSYGQDLPVSQVAFTDRYQLISYDEYELAEE